MVCISDPRRQIMLRYDQENKTIDDLGKNIYVLSLLSRLGGRWVECCWIEIGNLNTKVFACLCEIWSRLLVDFMDLGQNRKVPKYYITFKEAGTSIVDTLEMSWTFYLVYVFSLQWIRECMLNIFFIGALIQQRHTQYLFPNFFLLKRYEVFLSAPLPTFHLNTP